MRWRPPWRLEPEMGEGRRGEKAAARGPLQQALLDEEGLDDLFERVAGFGQGRGQGFHPDRTAAEGTRDYREIAAVERVEP